MKFITKDLFSKCDQISSLLRISSLLLKKALMGNFIFCAVDSDSQELIFSSETVTRSSLQFYLK